MLLDCYPVGSALLQRILNHLHDACDMLFMHAVTEGAKDE
jgi:hypothetical protein